MNWTYLCQLLYFIKYNAHMSIVRNFILQFYLNTLFMNRVGASFMVQAPAQFYV
jgi:hypothetical protein